MTESPASNVTSNMTSSDNSWDDSYSWQGDKGDASGEDLVFYSNERDLMVAVFEDYRKEFRPVKDSRKALECHIYPQLEKIIKLVSRFYTIFK